MQTHELDLAGAQLDNPRRAHFASIVLPSDGARLRIRRIDCLYPRTPHCLLALLAVCCLISLGVADSPASSPRLPELDPGGVRISPDGRLFAFYARVGEFTDLFTCGVGGHDLRNLTNTPNVNEYGPTWSRDGKLIAFYRGTGNQFEIYLMRPDGTAVLQVTRLGHYAGNPDISPKEDRIVFTSDHVAQAEVYTIATDGSDLRRLTSHDAKDWTPRYSPDGTRIAFVSDRDGDFSVYTMTTDGDLVRRVSDITAQDYYPDWSPDGQRIAFFSGAPPKFDVYVADLPSHRIQRVTDFGASGPGWMPDGRLFYLHDLEPNDRIVIHDLRTNERIIVGE